MPLQLNIPNFLGQGEKAPDYSGISNMFENALKGYKMAKEPAAMERTAEKENLANALQQLALEHKPTEQKLNDELIKARIQQATRPKAGALTPEEKTKQQMDVEKGKRDLKKKDEIEQLAKHLIATGSDVQGINDLLGRANFTGLIGGLLSKVGLGGKEMGEFNERANRLQGELARKISARGGAVAAQIAAKGKPSEWSRRGYNLGITKSMQENIEREFKQLKDEYKDLTGEELPYSLEDVFHDVTKQVADQHNEKHDVVHLKSPTGKDVWIPENMVEEALQQGATRA